MIRLAAHACLLSTVISLGLQLPASAQTASPVAVNKCEPFPPKTKVNYSGLSPAYYPAGQYYWNDPYGRRYLQYPLSATTHATGGTLAISFTNITRKPLKQVDFGLVAKGYVVAEVRDVGTFSHGAEVKHTFGLNPNVFPLGTGLAKCVPLRATYEDGTTWHIPRLPREEESLYK